jgi:K(+)-stimulated pyrophosphate-energized sodium pump
MIWAPILGVVGLFFAGIIYAYVVKQPVGTDLMREISEAIHEGAMAFLKREYRVLAIFIVVVGILLYVSINPATALAFLGGAVCSILAGFIGMQAATRANVRTAFAANQDGQGKALNIAFSGGAVMGLAVASLGLFGVGLLFYFYNQPDQSVVINGFAMGASSIALFARVGGGIYTKTADVGADLVGKVEAGIPEDDPRNPATIADNVGDNVGDVAGMGADIFESYVGSVIATLAIAAMAGSGLLSLLGGDSEAVRMAAMQFPLIVVMIGLVASLIGIGSIRILQAMSPEAALRYATYIAALLMLVGTYLATDILGLSRGVFWAILSGCLTGIVIALMTEYYTGGPPVRRIALCCHWFVI